MLREHTCAYTRAAIDFITRLLAKMPTERMTMAEALEHEWLAGPSSQHSESQPMALGGDSVWDINSFDEDDREEDLFTNDDEAPSDEEEGRWTRPATVSGTNMESFMGGTSGHSDESFSQPMGNLRLTTPGMIPRSNLHMVNGDSSRVHEVSPPSPPLTDEAMHIDQADQPSNDSKSANGIAIPPSDQVPNGLTAKPDGPINDTDTALLTPGASELGPGANKRKLDGVSAFSSGSLSPPPDESLPRGTHVGNGLLTSPPENGRSTCCEEGLLSHLRRRLSPLKASGGRKKGRDQRPGDGWTDHYEWIIPEAVNSA